MYKIQSLQIWWNNLEGISFKNTSIECIIWYTKFIITIKIQFYFPTNKKISIFYFTIIWFVKTAIARRYKNIIFTKWTLFVKWAKNTKPFIIFICIISYNWSITIIKKAIWLISVILSKSFIMTTFIPL